MTRPETLTFQGELVILKCWCGMRHAVPSELREHQLREHGTGREVAIYCPLGHSYVPAGESEAEKLKRQLAAEQRRASNLVDRLEIQRHRAAGYKGQLTKTKKRVAGGACPCCNRTFVDLWMHMKHQHPDYAGGQDDTPD